ncbi:hypothetical protein CB1_001141021 [Camelus ferus]|nr:hypothetical protein CB1_001141021 [Camelus ferus]
MVARMSCFSYTRYGSMDFSCRAQREEAPALDGLRKVLIIWEKSEPRNECFLCFLQSAAPRDWMQAAFQQSALIPLCPSNLHLNSFAWRAGVLATQQDTEGKEEAEPPGLRGGTGPGKVTSTQHLCGLVGSGNRVASRSRARASHDMLGSKLGWRVLMSELPRSFLCDLGKARLPTGFPIHFLSAESAKLVSVVCIQRFGS